jgi:glycosyltransferase involved in cell wall biosynthesis
VSISLCMIVKNEENMLERCLESISHIVDEMIIVDTGSTDKTIEIAKKFGAEIFIFPWDNSFANARNFSLEKASKDWILIMDGDDKFEKEDTEKLLQCIKDSNSTNAYYFRTLSFSGEKPDNNDIISNLNIRLIRNKIGYRFSGNIHEQLVPCISDIGKIHAIKIGDIRFYHYGYLIKTVNEKDKRNRNVELIKKELENNPQNPFMLYNMGNEYYAMLDFDKALEYYLYSYKYFEPSAGYSSRLIVRIVSCYEILKKYEVEFKFIDVGLKFYPNFTDLEYLRASTLLRQNKYLPTIKSLKKCIKMGEPPIYLSNLNGVGSFRPQFFLSTIYLTLGENKKAYRYCDLCLKNNAMHKDAYSHMHKILSLKNLSVKSIKTRLEGYMKTNLNVNSYILLSDVYYEKCQYLIAYEFAKKAEKMSVNKEMAIYYEGACLFYLKQYKKAFKCFKNIITSEFHNKAAFLSLLCKEFDCNIKLGSKFECIHDNENIYNLVFMKYMEIVEGKNCLPLSDDIESSKPFIKPIFNLLEILLKTNNLDNFEMALKLLNLISDDSVLLRLGKLYFKNGYPKLAYKEIMRSLKITDIIDFEGLEILKVIIDSGSLK